MGNGKGSQVKGEEEEEEKGVGRQKKTQPTIWDRAARNCWLL